MTLHPRPLLAALGPALALAGTVVLMPASVVAASGSPWSPSPSSSFTAPAGTRCAFTLHGQVLADREEIRTLEIYPDGSPRLMEVVGLLTDRFTNEDTGASVDRDLTGTGLFTINPDGSFTLTLQGGHMAIGLGPNDPGGPAFLVFTGAGFSVTIAADGSRTITYGSGTVENICQTLG